MYSKRLLRVFMRIFITEAIVILIVTGLNFKCSMAQSNPEGCIYFYGMESCQSISQQYDASIYWDYIKDLEEVKSVTSEKAYSVIILSYNDTLSGADAGSGGYPELEVIISSIPEIGKEVKVCIVRLDSLTLNLMGIANLTYPVEKEFSLEEAISIMRETRKEIYGEYYDDFFAYADDNLDKTKVQLLGGNYIYTYPTDEIGGTIAVNKYAGKAIFYIVATSFNEAVWSRGEPSIPQITPFRERNIYIPGIGSPGIIGQEVQIPVRIQNAPYEVSTFDFEIAYDSDAFEYTGLKRGNLTESFETVEAYPIDSGRIKIKGHCDVSGGCPISQCASGFLVMLKFKLKSEQEGKGYLFQLENLGGDIIHFPKIGGFFRISCTSDINGDGIITPADALLVYRCLRKSGPCPDCSDTNRSGGVNGFDVLDVFMKYLHSSFSPITSDSECLMTQPGPDGNVLPYLMPQDLMPQEGFDIGNELKQNVSLIWEKVRGLEEAKFVTSQKAYSVTILGHSYTVGIFDPATAEWVAVLSSIPEAGEEVKVMIVRIDYQTFDVKGIDRATYPAEKELSMKEVIPVMENQIMEEHRGKDDPENTEDNENTEVNEGDEGNEPDSGFTTVNTVDEEKVQLLSGNYIYSYTSGDSGGTIIVNRYAGKPIFWATTVCNGQGRLVIPSCSPLPEINIYIPGTGTPGRVGKEIRIPVRIQNALCEVQSFGFDVTYDVNAFEYTGLERGDLTMPFQTDLNGALEGVRAHQVTSGRLRIGGYTDEQGIVQGASGDLVWLIFKLKSEEEGRCCYLQIENLQDDMAHFSKEGGFFCMKCDGSGDLNGDGQVTPADALLAFRCYLEPGTCPACSDADRNGMVTPKDALCIFQKYLGTPS
ncbi:MAG: cohesin domain-containing protein [bacterium]